MHLTPEQAYEVISEGGFIRMEFEPSKNTLLPNEYTINYTTSTYISEKDAMCIALSSDYPSFDLACLLHKQLNADFNSASELKACILNMRKHGINVTLEEGRF